MTLVHGVSWPYGSYRNGPLPHLTFRHTCSRCKTRPFRKHPAHKPASQPRGGLPATAGLDGSWGGWGTLHASTLVNSSFASGLPNKPEPERAFTLSQQKTDQLAPLSNPSIGSGPNSWGYHVTPRSGTSVQPSCSGAVTICKEEESPFPHLPFPRRPLKLASPSVKEETASWNVSILPREASSPRVTPFPALHCRGRGTGENVRLFYRMGFSLRYSLTYS